MNEKIKIGISSCLLGMNVRFDGGHKKDVYLTKTLERFFEFVPVCPEVEMGMSIPRESIRLVGAIENPRLVGPKSGKDFTDEMINFSTRKISELQSMSLCGYILKKDSPSCGMERVRVYDQNNFPHRKGRGIFAALLIDKNPLLPVEEEGRLNDPRLRENFIERVFTYHRIQEFLKTNPKPGDLVRWHTKHKLTLLSHSTTYYRKLGKMVAHMDKNNWDEFLKNYFEIFMHTIKIKATTKKHTNVLQHMLGYFKKFIDADDKQEILELIEQYRQGLVPLIVPLTLFKHHLRKFPVDWLKEQVYLNPYPSELMLRNFV